MMYIGESLKELTSLESLKLDLEYNYIGEN